MNLYNYFEDGIFTEFYEIVKTFAIVMNETDYKIEILASYNRDGGIQHFAARCWIETEIRVNNRTTSVTEGITVWGRVVDFPWVNRETEESAIACAIGFLSERHRA